MSNEITEKKSVLVQWQPIIELIVVLAAILGSTIPLYLHTDNKLQSTFSEMRTESQTLINEMRNDMKEFHKEMTQMHGRVCVLEKKGVN